MNKPNIIRASTLAVAVGAALALTVPASASPHMAAASAATTGHGAHSPGGHLAGRGAALGFTRMDHPIGLGVTSTRTFAGYETSVAAGSATVVTSSFTVPTLTCDTTDRAIALGADIPIGNGTSGSAAYVFTGCVSGQATYYPGVLVSGTETDYPTMPVSAGDVIDVTVKVSVNRTKVEVTDVTTNVTEKLKGSGASAIGTLFGDSGWGSSTGLLEHVPVFTKLTYKDCVVDGNTLASSRPHALQRVNSIGTVQITPGNFWPGGTAFTTHFQHT